MRSVAYEGIQKSLKEDVPATEHWKVWLERERKKILSWPSLWVRKKNHHTIHRLLSDSQDLLDPSLQDSKENYPRKPDLSMQDCDRLHFFLFLCSYTRTTGHSHWFFRFYFQYVNTVYIPCFYTGIDFTKCTSWTANVSLSGFYAFFFVFLIEFNDLFMSWLCLMCMWITLD